MEIVSAEFYYFLVNAAHFSMYQIIKVLFFILGVYLPKNINIIINNLSNYIDAIK